MEEIKEMYLKASQPPNEDDFWLYSDNDCLLIDCDTLSPIAYYESFYEAEYDATEDSFVLKICGSTRKYIEEDIIKAFAKEHIILE